MTNIYDLEQLMSRSGPVHRAIIDSSTNQPTSKK